MDLFGKELFERIRQEKENGKFLVAQIAPAMRVSIGEEFGLPAGTDSTGKLISLLKKIGFDEVIDTSFGADTIVYIEAKEFAKMLEAGKGHFPFFNSCCVGWREYAAKKHPEIVPQISNIVTPMMMTGAIAKLFFSKEWKVNPENIIVVGIMPCSLKKHETVFKMPNGLNYVDYVVSTREMGDWARQENLDLNTMEEGKMAEISIPSKGGVIFGATGGITEALLTSIAVHLNDKKELLETRENENLREYNIKIGKYEMSVAIVYSYPALERILEKIRQGAKYHFIEVMGCMYGCVGGPGQPIPKEKDAMLKRAEALRKIADKSKERTPMTLDSIKNLDPSFFEHLNLKGTSRCFAYFPEK
jgi:NADH-quinone oxidoreductase subunit G/NADP-reducing hydrogenase subunit HndD